MHPILISSLHGLIRETYNQRQTLQVISEAGDSINQIGNDLSQDSSNNFQVIGGRLSFNQVGRPSLDLTGLDGSFGREDRAGYSGVGGGDGGDDGLKS